MLDVQLRKKIRQRVQRFVMHIADTTWLREEIRVAAPIPRVDCHGRSSSIDDARRKVSPVRYGTQAFMEEQQFRAWPAAAGNALNFESVPLHADIEIVFLVAALRAAASTGFMRSNLPALESHFGYPVVSALHRTYKIS
jgi:hypothetical protein